MRRIRRVRVEQVLLAALVLGVWTLALRPTAPAAHSGQICEIINGSGYGEVSGQEVYLHSVSGEVYCP